MDESTALKALIEEIVKRAVLPLETEIKSLRAELESIKHVGVKVMGDRPKIEGGTIIATSASALEQLDIDIVEPPIVVPHLPVASEVPAERTDFARFLQRGLEQEREMYKEEKPDETPKKKGWNPFKR
jgi:hypothetical protein